MFVGVGIPIPIIDEDMLLKTAIKNKDIKTVLVYKSAKENLDIKVDYETLRSGAIEIHGKKVPTAPLSSLKVAREIAQELKNQIQTGSFLLTEPVERLPMREKRLKKLEIREV